VKYANYVFAVAVILLCCGGLYLLVPVFTDYRQTRESLYEIRQELERQDREMQVLKREITALRSDPKAIERVAREKFGLCKDGEKVYHFDAPPAEPATD